MRRADREGRQARLLRLGRRRRRRADASRTGCASAARRSTTPTASSASTQADATDWFAMWARHARQQAPASPADVQALDQLNIETSMVTLGQGGDRLRPLEPDRRLPGASTRTPLAMVPYPTRRARRRARPLPQAVDVLQRLRRRPAMPEEAAKFISFFVNDPEAAEVLGVERGMPESAAVRDALAPHARRARPGRDRLHRRASATSPGRCRRRRRPGAGEIDASLLKRVNEEVAFGASTPEDAAPSLRRRGHRTSSPARLSRWPRAARRRQSAPAAAGAAGIRSVRLARPGLGRERRRATCSCCPG